MNAEGQPSKATLQRTVQAPSFGIADKKLPQRTLNAPALPSIQLWFNADIRPDGIEAQCGFVNVERTAVPARCRQGTAADGVERLEGSSGELAGAVRRAPAQSG